MSTTSGSHTNSLLIEGGVAGDAVPRVAMLATGQVEIGSGSAARDVNLYRSAANVLRTDDSLVVGAALTVTTGLTHSGTTLGVLGTTATTKQTVTGAKDGNAALASLLTALVAYGLITDESEA
jgi:hypothetical protein